MICAPQMTKTTSTRQHTKKSINCGSYSLRAGLREPTMTAITERLLLTTSALVRQHTITTEDPHDTKQDAH
jgi:hypothetical protein